MKALSTAALSCVLFCGSMLAQAPSAAPPQTEADFKGAVVGFMHAIHATNNLDTTAAFYKEVFGLSSAIRPFAAEGPRQLTNSPEANLRVSTILGLVGGGGLGQAIYNNIQLGFYPQVATMILLVYVLVVATDWAGDRIRNYYWQNQAASC